jgi:DnaJ-domain-containing protein 1
MAKDQRSTAQRIADNLKNADILTLKNLKRLGVTERDALATINRGIDRLASEGQWRDSEVAMVKADFVILAREVWK